MLELPDIILLHITLHLFICQLTITPDEFSSKGKKVACLPAAAALRSRRDRAEASSSCRPPAATGAPPDCPGGSYMQQKPDSWAVPC